jgi:hypothetical protein
MLSLRIVGLGALVIVGLAVAVTRVAADTNAACKDVDLDALRHKADAALEANDFATCESLYERVAACDGKLESLDRAYICACRAQHKVKATQLYRRVPANSTKCALRQVCLREGIDPGPC